MKRTIKILLVSLILCFCCSFNVSAYTEDDVRDLYNKDRVDDTFTQSEIDLIIEQYQKIERANMTLRLFELGKEIDINNDLIEEYNQLESDLEKAHMQLADSFQGGKSIETVLKDKSNLESVLYKIDSLRDVGYEIEVEYIPNIWEEKYYKVQNMRAILREQFEIGEVGENLNIPLVSSINIAKPFGLSLNKEENTLSLHNGIDFRGGIGTFVMAQWNGVVSRIYKGEHGKVVEIVHGDSLKTKYENLEDIRVSVGETVTQYQVIGKLVKIDDTVNSFLHFEVEIDEERMNPLYLYGSKSVDALKKYASYNPEKYFDLEDLVEDIKEKPDKEQESNMSEEEGLIKGDNTEYGSYDRHEFLDWYYKHQSELEDKYGSS